jgi:hypothetical protein
MEERTLSIPRVEKYRRMGKPMRQAPGRCYLAVLRKSSHPYIMNLLALKGGVLDPTSNNLIEKSA